MININYTNEQIKIITNILKQYHAMEYNLAIFQMQILYSYNLNN